MENFKDFLNVMIEKNKKKCKKKDMKIEKQTSELNEAKKYPNQYSAEFLLDWTTALEDVFTSGVDDSYKKAFEKADKIRRSLWDKTFGDNSPWSIDTKRGKRVVEWDKFKAEKLGLI